MSNTKNAIDSFELPTSCVLPEMAFPNRDTRGMSLRDWFAGQALYAPTSLSVEDMAAWCYKLADAMLAKRTERSEQ
ncbi:MAG: hypothetical protein Ta2A_13860 [Treponemataceae bacterium]|nr:MAG: hypothetical protein Ta2A_13860 [Treponemataceae bacterium]